MPSVPLWHHHLFGKHSWSYVYKVHYILQRHTGFNAFISWVFAHGMRTVILSLPRCPHNLTADIQCYCQDYHLHLHGWECYQCHLEDGRKQTDSGWINLPVHADPDRRIYRYLQQCAHHCQQWSHLHYRQQLHMWGGEQPGKICHEHHHTMWGQHIHVHVLTHTGRHCEARVSKNVMDSFQIFLCILLLHFLRLTTSQVERKRWLECSWTIRLIQPINSMEI